MTKKELMHKVYQLAIETKLIKTISEKQYNSFMWNGKRKEEIENFYNYLLNINKVNA